MIWKFLFDLILAFCAWAGFGFDLDRPVADACYTCNEVVPCQCPKDSPCRKDCCKDNCTCQPTGCGTGVCPNAFSDAALTSSSPVFYGPMPRVFSVEFKVGKHEPMTLVLPAGV